jgi:hypothetical protein
LIEKHHGAMIGDATPGSRDASTPSTRLNFEQREA